MNPIRFGSPAVPHPGRPHAHGTIVGPDGTMTRLACRCGKAWNGDAVKRGRRNRERGNEIERWVCAQLGIRRVGQYGGKEDGGGADDFLSVQVKSGGAFQAALLSKIHTVPARADQLRAWVTASTPGSGGKREGVISFDLAEFAAWYGKGMTDD